MHRNNTAGVAAALHLIKLAVGIRDIAMLAERQAGRSLVRDGRPLVPGWTRRRPVQADAIVASGGSIYWVIQGTVACRQQILGFETAEDDDGQPYCLMLLSPTLVPTAPVRRKPFQGWRYLKPGDAPRDLGTGNLAEGDEMPADMRRELAALGLL